MTLTIDFGFHVCLSDGRNERRFSLPLVKREIRFKVATWAKAAGVVVNSILWGIR